MIPKLAQGTQIKIEAYKTRTYRIDFENKRLVGIVDGLEAAAQAMQKTLRTERYDERIYSGDYGIELERLIGASLPFVEANLEPALLDALTPDDRVLSVSHISIKKNSSDSLTISCQVATTLGDVSARFELST